MKNANANMLLRRVVKTPRRFIRPAAGAPQAGQGQQQHPTQRQEAPQPPQRQQPAQRPQQQAQPPAEPKPEPKPDANQLLRFLAGH